MTRAVQRFGNPWGVCLVLTTVLLTACEQEVVEKAPVVRPVHAIRVADVDGLMRRSFAGRAAAGKEVNLSFRVSGPLQAFPVKVGDEVKKGDVVVRMDPTDYETSLRTIQGQLEREQARAKRAQTDLERLEKIQKLDPGAVAEVTLDRARQVRDSARASARSVRAAVQKAKDQLSYTELEAPFDGVIVETYVENFETVVAKQPMLRLLDPSSIELVVNVPEGLIGLTPYVTKILVEFDALPGIQVRAEIKEIGREATQATRTYPVTVVMAQPPGAEILPGMAGRVSVVSRPPEDAGRTGIEIPATAVFTGDDVKKSYVWVIDESSKKLARREVQLGMLSRFGTRVMAGLEPGEWIVIKGVHSVAEGDQVRILDAAEAGASS